MKRIISVLMTLVLTASMLCGLSFESSAAGNKHPITAENPAVVIRSTFATGKFKEGWGGVFAAVPVKDKEGYILYDVIIWEDRINLYKFPNDLEQNEEYGFFEEKATEPEWFDGKKINEVLFCQSFLEIHPMKCIRGRFFTVDGLVDDEESLKMEIYDRIKDYLLQNGNGLKRANRIRSSATRN